jgi:membrane protein DedA with SNARE-associated domain
MDFMRGIVIWGGVALAAGALGGVLAGVKNRDLSSWIAWCFVLPPLVFILLLLPRYQGVRPRRPRLDEGEERGF